MSDYCSQCGSPVPSGQRICSMCYGDPDYGSDGYYRDFIEEAVAEEHQRRQLLDEADYVEVDEDDDKGDSTQAQ